MTSQSSAVKFGTRHHPASRLVVSQSAWLSKPLCCRYLLAEFNVLRLPVKSGSAIKQSHWRWALGTFRQAEYELLGAWPRQVPLPAVLDELRDRGIERMEACCAEADEDVASRFPDAVPLLRTDDRKAAVPPSHLRRFSAKRWAALEAAVAKAEFLQLSLERAIERHGPFADEGAAAAFVLDTLENADRQLQGLPRSRSTRPRWSQAGTLHALASGPAAGK